MERSRRQRERGKGAGRSRPHQLRRERYRRQLHEWLASADDQAFFWQVWAARALTANRRDLASRVLKGLPTEPYALAPPFGPIAPWHLETLVNERLMLPPFRAKPRRDGRVRIFNTDRFMALQSAASRLHAWEDAESGIVLDRLDVLKEMPRLTHRQFEWQRGFRTGPAYYRWAFLYAGPLARAHFEAKTGGLKTTDFIYYGFAAHAIFNDRPVWRRHLWIEQLGFDQSASDKALALLSHTPETARRLAKSVRTARGGPAYQRSVLRVAPIFSFDNGQALVAPVPDLISARVTSGLFYDHADAPSDVRNEVGARFELYVRDLLNASLPGLSTTPGRAYRHRKQPIDPPDLMLQHEGRLAAVFECKARKMSFDARFSETSETDPGHDELAKGVFQLWRYFAHHRLGIAAGPKPDPETIPVLLTLDNWMQMSSDRQHQVLKHAEDLAAAKDPLIAAEDRRTIVFCSIEDLESTLHRSDEPRFLANLAMATEERFTGWMLPNIYKRGEDDLDRPFPLWERMSEVLPWWNGL